MKKINQLLHLLTKLPLRTLFLALLLLAIPTIFLLRLDFSPDPASAISWPSTANSWLKRKQLTLLNNSGQTLETNTTYSLTINTKALYDAGNLQSACQDLRIYYQPNDSSATKLNYYFDPAADSSCATSETTTIYFPLKADIANSSEDSNYYLYFGNSSATDESTVSAFDIGTKTATLHCGFKGDTTCINADGAETPTTETGAIRYSGSQSALSFDGVNDSLIITQSSSINNLNNLTYEGWIWWNSSDESSFKHIFTKGWSKYFRINNQRITGAIDTNGTDAASTASTVFPSKQWVHLAITYNDSGDRKIRYYQNGTEVSYSTQTAATGSLNSDSTGNFNIFNVESSQRISGKVDEVRISNTIRYTGNFTPPTIPFVRDEFTKLLLHFDENGDDPRNSSKAIDDSGNANHGTITGAKYVAGLVGVDASTSDTGNSPSQSYASHESIFLEESTTNLIPNPSFEHPTFDTSWDSVGTNLTFTENSTVPYYKFGSKSAKIVASGTDNNSITVGVDPNSTAVHYLYAYVYNGTSTGIGGTVDNTVAQIVWEGVAQSTTSYTDMGGGWWRIKYSTNTTDSTNEYGIYVPNGKTVYVDGFQLALNRRNHVDHIHLDTYVDGSLGTGYSWSGTAHDSTSSRADTDLRFSTTNNILPTTGTISFWLKPHFYLSTNAES